MATRMWTNPGRIIVSRPGYNAGPSLSDQNKILDSDWQFSGLIIAKGRITDPGGGDIHISFPSCGYIPSAVVLNRANDGGDYANDLVDVVSPIIVTANNLTYVTPVPAIVADGLLTIPRNPLGHGSVNYLGTLDYTIYAIGPG